MPFLSSAQQGVDCNTFTKITNHLKDMYIHGNKIISVKNKPWNISFRDIQKTLLNSALFDFTLYLKQVYSRKMNRQCIEIISIFCKFPATIEKTSKATATR